jgi:23S rRNA (guanosine2251-2'-O)-methyltransferase
MSANKHQIRQCTNPSCLFRFPDPADTAALRFCPKCGWALETILLPDSVPTGRIVQTNESAPIVEALLDNIRSSYNVGSIFRAADGAGLRQLYLCGITPTPDNPSIAKTSLGAETSVSWTCHLNAVRTAKELKERGSQIWAMEASPRSRSLFTAVGSIKSSPIVLVVGNEVCGVDPEILALCDEIVWIPMEGLKESLNVSIAFGIAAYTLRYSFQIRKN